MDPLVLVALCVAAFLAAFMDSIVGGGGVVSLPALLAAGLPPHLALGTNKLAATGASFSATLRYVQSGKVVRRLALVLLPLSLVGSVAGSVAVLQVDPTFVRGAVVVVMLAMGTYVLLRKRFGAHDAFDLDAMTWGHWAAVCALALAVGFYDGFLGPGTGTFLLFGLVGILQMGFLRAAALGRVLNFASNVAALMLFAFKGQVDVAVGLPMMAAMAVGGWYGSRFALTHGDRFIRPLFVVVTGALLVRLVTS